MIKERKGKEWVEYNEERGIIKIKVIEIEDEEKWRNIIKER